MGLSQRELAELCGTTQSAIARLERGGRPPRIDTLLRIAEALDCDLVVDLVPARLGTAVIVGCLGDSITAGSPLWDPDDAVRARIAAPDERSQWEWWAMRADPSLEFRNHGVYGERTDQIAHRLEAAVEGADALVVQGGINDIVQQRPVEEALKNLTGMVERGRGLGLRVALADVLPWNNGDSRAAKDIARSTSYPRDRRARRGAALPVPRHARRPSLPHRMRDDLTDDGDHPSVEGYRLLGERAFAAF